MIRRILGVFALGGGLWWLVRKFCPGGERLQINAPTLLAIVSSPITVSGVGQATQHNQLGLRVRDQAGTEIGTGSASVTGALGARGPFSGTVSYTLSGGSQPGRVEVFDTSPRDGNLVHLSTVEVTLM